MQKHTITLEVEVIATTATAALSSLIGRDLVFQVRTESGVVFDLKTQRPIRNGLLITELARTVTF